MNAIDNNFLDVVSDGEITSSSNLLEQIAFVKRGIKVDTIDLLGQKLKWKPTVLAKAIGTTATTLERHRKNKTSLNISVSENALEVAKLATFTISYLGSIERWNQWLNTANVQFDNQPPFNFIKFIRGRESIKRSILALESRLAGVLQ